MQGHHRHELHDFAAGLTQGVAEAAAAEETAETVEQQADLDAFLGALGEQPDDAFAHGITTEDKSHQVNAVFGVADGMFEALE